MSKKKDTRPLPKASAVKNAKPQPGAALKAVQRQVNGDSNPHQRTDSYWGVGAKSTADEKAASGRKKK